MNVAKLDINPEYLTLIKTILRQHLPSNAKVGVFGSRVTGKARKYSDVDLIINISGENVPIQTLFVLATEFEESDLPFKVDVVDWNKLSAEFQEMIADEIIELQF